MPRLLLAAAAAACASALALEVDLAQRGFARVSAANTTLGVIALVDTRVALSCARSSSGAACAARVPLRGREQLLHVYSVDPESGAVALTQQLELPRVAGAAAPYDAAARQPPSPLPPVGVLYELWHAFAATAQANVSARGGTPLAVEDVLQAPNGSLAMSDVLDRWGVRDAADCFFYQEQPSSGYYCMYRRRAGEAGLVPDCAGISATAARHAAQLSSAGISFVAVDATNLGTPSTEAEVIQVRPSEVLFEEWAMLRAAGVPTPAIAAWQRAEAGATLWQNWLELYNNASYDALVARGGPANAQKLFFVPSGADAGVVAAIEANGGRHDVLVVPMWANDHRGAAGEWAFMAPCTNSTNTTAGPGATYTTSVVGLGRGASACFQQLAVGSPVGSSLSFSPSFQLMYGSVPFSNANKYEGLTFKRQWATLFEGAGAALEAGRGDGALAGALPDNLFVSSFNEWISQPQPNPYPAPWAVSMGLWGDNESQALFVDSYGTSCSRDIEPSARPGGDAVYGVLASCLRVAALLYAAAATERGAGGAFAGASPRALRATFGRGAGSAGLSACAVAGEACCAYNESSDGYVPAWSFRAANGSDYLVTADPREVAQLRATPSITEQCTGFPGQTDFCYAPSALASAATAWRGPFILHSGGCGLVSVGVPSGVPVTPGLRLPGRLPLYRCMAAPGSGTGHFLTADATCGGVGVAEALGCTHATRSSNMARPLRTCHAANGVHYHVTDGVCDDGDVEEGVLGYVR